MASDQNIFFVGIARRDGGAGIVVGSFSYNTETDLAVVKQVLEQPNMSLVQGKHYSFAVGQMAWHLIQGRSKVESVGGCCCLTCIIYIYIFCFLNISILVSDLQTS
jgi:hypothetical protein